MPTFAQRAAAYLPSWIRNWAGRSFAAGFLAGRDLDEAAKSARMTKAFEQSAWISSACNLVSGPISAVPLKFYDGDTEYADKNFANWWARPALGPHGKRIPIGEVTRDLANWAKLEGEFFIVLDDSWLLATASRQSAALPPFIIARPEKTRLIIQGGQLKGYEWIDAGGKRFVFVPEQVWHWKDFNPHDDWRGCGALRPSKIAAEGDFLAGVYIRDLMRNNGDQGAFVIGKTGLASQEQRDQITALLREKRALLQRGIAKDVFLTGDITVDRPEPKAADANLVQTRLANRHEVYIAFGVPPSMADIQASYSVGSASDWYRLITGTCAPLGCHIAAVLAQIASIMTGRTLTAEFDWDDHPVMQAVRGERLKAADGLWGKGMPMKAINEYLDLGMKPFPGWETGYLPFNIAPADAMEHTPAQDPAASPDYAETSDEDPAVTSLRLLMLARQRQHAPLIQPAGAAPEFRSAGCVCAECEGGAEEIEFQSTRDAKETAQWRTHMAKRREAMKVFQSRFNRQLMIARAEVLAKIERHEKSAGAVTKAAAGDLIFDLAKWKKGFVLSMRGAHENTLKAAGQQLFAELGKDDPFTMPPAKALAFLRSRENKMSGVADEVHQRVTGALQDGLSAGETMAELADRVRGEFNDLSKGRATVMAQTEVAASYGVARDAAMREAGVQFKRWLTSGNANVRTAHRAANGQTVMMDQSFVVDGEQLAHPGDPKGSAGNVINCHCVSIAEAQPDQD